MTSRRQFLLGASAVALTVAAPAQRLGKTQAVAAWAGVDLAATKDVTVLWRGTMLLRNGSLLTLNGDSARIQHGDGRRELAFDPETGHPIGILLKHGS